MCRKQWRQLPYRPCSHPARCGDVLSGPEGQARPEGRAAQLWDRLSGAPGVGVTLPVVPRAACLVPHGGGDRDKHSPGASVTSWRQCSWLRADALHVLGGLPRAPGPGREVTAHGLGGAHSL